ncbi:MAG: bifunctional phosphopantothenoylcysteine decarboxylase/phosphopantothenate--cysteine ligase CoaBC [Coriobacteriaceae bacterium]|nr:bifunctional phosphopantothenoylcysteine decarboxylase/phosphopantothenate--cysteine ligase CoaBC [Coriobacteriaceae bacterium]
MGIETMQTVLLGITGCIAAYKACEIVRGLQKARDDLRVKVVMTEHATEFVGPTTFRALTHEEVAVGMFDEPGDAIHHVSLAEEADLFCIAPATANTVAKIAQGRADDLLSTTALAFEKQLVVAPAMNEAMYHDEATQENLRTLEARGVRIISPDEGYLACGKEGEGRLADPEAIVEAILGELDRRRDLEGRHVLVTAGPTHEALDAVRYLSNPSSGLTGILIAEEAALRGAEVTLVCGPTALVPPAGVDFVSVTSADEMLKACEAVYDTCDAAVFAAAVTDWRAADASDKKIKRDGEGLTLELEENPDIAATCAARNAGCYNVIFAAETGEPTEKARRKLADKGADLCVANDVSGELGFGSTDNHVWFVTEKGCEELATCSKRTIATHLLNAVVDALSPHE